MRCVTMTIASIATNIIDIYVYNNSISYDSRVKLLLDVALAFRRPIHIGKVIYWSMPHSIRLNTACSECRHEIT